MPQRPLTICAEPGCHRLVRKGRCPQHARRPWAQSLSRQERGYDAAWDKARRRVLREESVCRLCGREDEPTVDHIIPKSQGGTDARHNLQRLCKRCQQEKAAREGNAAKAAMR